MIINLNNISDLSENIGDYDVCIIGSGPAGVASAIKFEEKGFKVALLEAGDLTYTNDSQDTYACTTTGLEAWVNTTRLRYFGGTSNHWAGRCRPFDESDFEDMGSTEYTGWPISYSSYMEFFDEACDFLDISGNFSAINENSFAGFSPDKFELSPPTRVNSKFLDHIESSRLITLYTCANFVSADFDNDKILNANLVNYKNNHFFLVAKYFVLATGAVENAKILLNLNSKYNNRIGNQSGWVGKCFMEHMNISIGEFFYKDVEDTSPRQFFTSNLDDYPNKSNFTFRFLGEIKSYGRTAAIKTFFKNLSCNLNIQDKVQFIAEFNCPGSGVISTLTEQLPHSDSHVGLLTEKDRFGNYESYLNWKVSEADRNAIRAMAINLAKGFSDAGLGYIKINDYILDSNVEIPIAPHAHHMGTTRMANSSDNGVVDEYGRVFGTDNFFVAGSSIFPMGGGCNPTLPLVQLSLRTTDHISNLLPNKL